jgi:hypothetical protein
MPTLFRLITVLLVLAGLAYGAMFALAWYVKPKIGIITVKVPLEKIEKRQQEQKTVSQ